MVVTCKTRSVQAAYFAESPKVSCLSVLVLVLVVHSVEDSDFVPEFALVEAFSEEEELLEVSAVVGRVAEGCARQEGLW